MSALEQNNEGSFMASLPKKGNIAVMSGKRAGIIVVGCFVTLILGLHAISPEKPLFVFDPPYLAPLLNTVFVFLLPLAVTFVTWQSFMVSGVSTILFFSCGVFCIGVTMMAATWLQYPYSANVGVTIHNTGSLAASVLFGVGVIANMSGGVHRTEVSGRRLVSIVGYSSILVLAILLSLETIRGNIPVFFTPAVGFSTLRQGVLGSAIVLFIFSSLFLMKIYFRDKAAFLYWNSLALMLYASGLFGVWMQAAVGSPVGWVGRTAQFLSGVYFLIAARAALRDAKASGVSVGAAIASFFRESELNYRTLVDTLTDAIISTDTQGRILVWNRAAENMFGYVQGEAVGFTIEELAILPDFSKFNGNIAWVGTTSQIPNILETLGKRKKGGKFPVEVSTSSRETRGGIIVTLIVRDITERKQAQETLRASEARLRRFYESGIIGIAYWKWDGPILEANDRFLEMLGYTRDDLAAGKINWMTITPAEYGALDKKTILALKERGKQSPAEKEYFRKDGTRISVLLAGALLDDAPYDGVAFALDVTEHKQAEEALRASEEKYRTLFESMTQGVVYQDAEGKVISANSAAEMILGVTLEQMKGRTSGDPQWRSICEDGSDFPGDAHPTMTSLMTGNETKNVIMGVYNPRLGKYRWLKIDAVPQFRPGEDKPYQVYSLFDDITERKQAEEALRESEERLQLTLQASAVGTFEVDLTTGAGRWNAVEYELLGLKPGDTQGAPETFFHYVHPQDIGELRAEWEKATRAGKLDAEFRVIRADGEERWLAGKGQFFFTETADSGTTGGKKSSDRFLGVNFDITERKRAEEALKHRTIELQHLTETLEQRVKERTAEIADLTARMVSAQEDERRRISYDLHDNVWQTLLAIRAEIERLFSGEEKRDWAGLRKASEKLKVTTLNTVEKIRSLQGDLWPYVLDDIGIVPTIDWYCREFERKHPGLTIERHESVSEGQVPLPAKIVIYRILQEALGNVTKHSQARHVNVRLTKRDNKVEFIIEDDGIGFDPEEAIARKAPWGGLGLLSIKARTELSGGSFGVDSAKGKGTTVRSSWPLGEKA